MNELPVAALCVLELPPIQVPNLHRYNFDVDVPGGRAGTGGSKRGLPRRLLHYYVFFSGNIARHLTHYVFWEMAGPACFMSNAIRTRRVGYCREDTGASVSGGNLWALEVGRRKMLNSQGVSWRFPARMAEAGTP